MERLRELWHDESGVAMTEYILVVSLVAIAGIAAYCHYSNRLNDKTMGAGTDLANYPMDP